MNMMVQNRLPVDVKSVVETHGDMVAARAEPERYWRKIVQILRPGAV